MNQSRSSKATLDRGLQDPRFLYKETKFTYCVLCARLLIVLESVKIGAAAQVLESKYINSAPQTLFPLIHKTCARPFSVSASATLSRKVSLKAIV